MKRRVEGGGGVGVITGVQVVAAATAAVVVVAVLEVGDGGAVLRGGTVGVGG